MLLVRRVEWTKISKIAAGENFTNFGKIISRNYALKIVGNINFDPPLVSIGEVIAT